MNATGKRRLLALADFLELVPPARFNLKWWRETTFEVHGCGTTACAVGWACAMPAFKRDGLRFSGNQPIFNGAKNWPAVEKFFTLKPNQATRLFDDDSYLEGRDTPPIAVARRIRRFVASSKARAGEYEEEWPS